MGFFVEDPGLMVTYLLYKTAVVLAVLRWIVSWALSFGDISFFFSSTDPQESGGSASSAASCSSTASVSSQMIRDGLALTTFVDVKERVPLACDTCAVCLGQLREKDEVRELRNCCHVFHRECIDRWVDHEDNHKTCPLCRAPLLTSSQAFDWPRDQPSWAVERLLYLFGDDLLP